MRTCWGRDDNFRKEIVRRYHSGEKMQDLSKEIGVSLQAISYWNARFGGLFAKKKTRKKRKTYTRQHANSQIRSRPTGSTTTVIKQAPPPLSHADWVELQRLRGENIQLRRQLFYFRLIKWLHPTTANTLIDFLHDFPELRPLVKELVEFSERTADES